MALVTLVDQQPATGAVAVWNLINLLVGSAGWTKIADSDGTTYSSSGTQVTSGNSGAHGLGNASAWVRLRAPDSSIAFTIQRGTNNLVWRVKVSQSGFSGGSPSATQTPSATDEAIVLGGGTDASPTYAQMIGSSDGSGYWSNYLAQTSSPYAFAFWAWANLSNPPGYIHSKFILEPLQSWSLETGDTFAYNVHCAGGAAGADTCSYTALGDPTGTQGGTPFTWLAKGGGSASFVRIPACTRSSDNSGQIVAPDGGAANPLTGAWDLSPIAYERRGGASGTDGWKGFSSMLFWRPTSAHKTGDLYTAATTGDCIVLSQVVLNLWAGHSPSGTNTTPTTRTAHLIVPPSTPTDTTPPVVTNVSPVSGSVIERRTAIGFDVTDNVGLARCIVYVSFPGSSAPEVAYDGDALTAEYSTDSTVSVLPLGKRFLLLRAGGWPATPTIHIDAVDTAGNETS